MLTPDPAIAPVAFALNLHAAPDTLQAIEAQATQLEAALQNTDTSSSHCRGGWAPHTRADAHAQRPRRCPTRPAAGRCACGQP